MQRAAAQASKKVLDREHSRHRHTCVMPTKGVQPMCIGSGDQWFAEPGCHSLCPAIWIEWAEMKMTELNRVKTIDLCEQPRSD